MGKQQWMSVVIATLLLLLVVASHLQGAQVWVARNRPGPDRSHRGTKNSEKPRAYRREDPSRQHRQGLRKGPGATRTLRNSASRGSHSERRKNRRPHRIDDDRVIIIEIGPGSIARNGEYSFDPRALNLRERAPVLSSRLRALDEKIQRQDALLQDACRCAHLVREHLDDHVFSPPGEVVDFVLDQDLPFPRPEPGGRYAAFAWQELLSTLEGFKSRLRAEIAGTTETRDQTLRQFNTTVDLLISRRYGVSPDRQIIIIHP